MSQTYSKKLVLFSVTIGFLISHVVLELSMIKAQKLTQFMTHITPQMCWNCPKMSQNVYILEHGGLFNPSELHRCLGGAIWSSQIQSCPMFAKVRVSLPSYAVISRKPFIIETGKIKTCLNCFTRAIYIYIYIYRTGNLIHPQNWKRLAH